MTRSELVSAALPVPCAHQRTSENTLRGFPVASRNRTWCLRLNLPSADLLHLGIFSILRWALHAPCNFTSFFCFNLVPCPAFAVSVKGIEQALSPLPGRAFRGQITMTSDYDYPLFHIANGSDDSDTGTRGGLLNVSHPRVISKSCVVLQISWKLPNLHAFPDLEHAFTASR